MAKKRKAAEREWDTTAASEYVAEQFRAAMVKPDSGLEDSAVAAVSDVGLYLPHLCLRVLFQRTTFPLERSMIIFGPPKSNKSTLLYWFYDLFRRAHGKYLHVEVEDKDTPIMRLALTGYRKDAGWVRRCASMNDFQSAVYEYINWFQGICGAAAGPGRRVPFVLGVDSLMAKLTDEATAVMEKNSGVPTRRFADEARSLSDWFKDVPGRLQGWPFNLITINHDKPKPGAHAGQVVHQSPGGSAPNFYATYKILVQKIAQIKQQATGWEGNKLKLTMEASALGASHRTIDAEIVWRMEPTESITGKPIMIQRAMWDWGKATIEMLHNLVVRKDKEGARAAAIREIIGIGKGTAGKYYATGLGVPASQAMPARQLAALLESNREVLDALEPRLGIHSSYQYQPGRLFDEQRAEACALVDDYIPAVDVATEITDDETEPEEEGDGE